MNLKDRLGGLLASASHHSRSSSSETNSTNNASTTLSGSASSVEATFPHDSSIITPSKRLTSFPSSSHRYTISSNSEPRNSYSERPNTNSEPKICQSTSQGHRRRLSVKLASPILPVRDFASRLSRAVSLKKSENGEKTSGHILSSDCLSPTVGFNHRLSFPESIRVTAATPFGSPEASTNQIYRDNNPRHSFQFLSRSRNSLEPTATKAPRSVSQASTRRPRSRDSSSSSRDRSYPPPAFPTRFYHRDDSNPTMIATVALQQDLQTAMPASRPSSSRYTIISGPTGSTEMLSANSQQWTDHNNPSRTILDHDQPCTPKQVAKEASEKFQSPSPISSRRPQTISGLSRPLSFHDTIHHYTTCPHTSPPETRPLNVQPYFEVLSPNVQNSQFATRSVISGSCFSCDTATRRDAETMALLKFNPELSDIANELISVIDIIETLISEHMLESLPSTPIARALAILASLKETGLNGPANDIEEIEAFETRIMMFENRIADLSTEREKEVERIWEGYTQRWGPGTLGVVKSPAEKVGSLPSTPGRGHSRLTVSMSASSGRYHSKSFFSSPPGSAPSTPSRRTFGQAARAYGTPDRNSNFGSSAMKREGSSRSTGGGYFGPYLKHRNGSVVSSSGSGTAMTFGSLETPEGRMRVDWIRESKGPVI